MTRKTYQGTSLQSGEKEQATGKVVHYLPRANREEAQLARAAATPEQLFDKIDRALLASSPAMERDVAAIARLAALEAMRVGLNLRTRSG